MSAKELTSSKIGEALIKLRESSKPILKKKVFKDAMLGTSVDVFVGDRDMFIKRIGDDYNFPDGAYGYYYAVPDCIIRLEGANKSHLVHELTHFCLDVLRYRGIVITEDSEEVLCYMLEYYYSICSERLDTISHLFTDED